MTGGAVYRRWRKEEPQIGSAVVHNNQKLVHWQNNYSYTDTHMIFIFICLPQEVCLKPGPPSMQEYAGL